MSTPSNVTQILRRLEEGDSCAAENLLPIVYEELRQLAADRLKQEKPGQTLQATALVHEAWLKLVDVDYVQQWSSRRHFFGAAAEAMRRILIEKARRKHREKHGADWQRITIELDEIPEASQESQLEAVDVALQKFEQIDPVGCELVKLRYFAGLTLREAGQMLDLAPRTADRLWAYAKAWLLREIQHPTDEN